MTTRVAEKDSAKEASGVGEELLAALYRTASLLRRLGDRCRTLSTRSAEAGSIAFAADCVGEEAAILGAVAALDDSDWLFPAARDHGAALWRGMPLEAYFDHLFGNASDVAKGRPLPEQLSYKAARVASVSAPMGSHLTHAVGAAMAAKVRPARADGTPDVVLAMLGDDDVSSGDYHNALNFAGVSKAPVIFLCRNDRATGAAPQAGGEDVTIEDRASAYGLRSARCDGEDALEVLAAVRDAVAHARSGGGPTLIEATITGAVDPLERLRALVSWDEAREQALAAELQEALDQAENAARRKPRPAVGSMFEDVFAEMPWHLRDQRRDHS
jgi:pyruvate dehydrogenase E1 component subunit alpha